MSLHLEGGDALDLLVEGSVDAYRVWLHGLQCLAFHAKRKGALAVVRASSTARRGRELAAW